MSVASLQAALDEPGSGTLLTSSRLVDVDTGDGDTVGVVSTPPSDLAAKSGLTLEEYSLARCIRSEGYGGARLGKAAAAVAIGQAIRNGAKLSKKSITSKLTASTFPAARGLYGQQTGRYAATTSDPTRWHGMVARAVLEGSVPDLAKGSDQFVDPKVFAGGTQGGKPLQKFESVMRRWIVVGGARWRGPIPTIDSYHLIFLRKTILSSAAASLAAVLEVFRQGIAGQNAPAPGNPDADAAMAVALGLAAAAAGAAWWVLR